MTVKTDPTKGVNRRGNNVDHDIKETEEKEIINLILLKALKYLHLVLLIACTNVQNVIQMALK